MRKTLAALIIGFTLGAGGCGSVPQRNAAEAQRERLVDLNDRAAHATGRGEYRRAATLYREALRLAESVEDFRAIAVNSLNLAAIYQALEEFQLADRALDRLLAAPALFERQWVAEAAGRKAMLAMQAGQFEAVEKWLGRAENDCQAPACRAHTALLNLRGQLLLERGVIDEAQAVLARSLASSRADGNREEEANALRLYGRAASRAGEHSQAVARLGQALDLDKQLALPRKIALDLLALGEAELAHGTREAARDYAQRALDVSRATGSRSLLEQSTRLVERTR